jgi:hypothetical protein
MRWHVSREWFGDRRARVLLLTDSASAWRFRRPLMAAGCAQLNVDGGRAAAAEPRGSLAHWRPDLVLVSVRAAMLQSMSMVLATDGAEPSPSAFLYQSSDRHWSRDASTCRIPFGERERIAGIIALVRFLRGLRNEGMPCVDFADFGAWLARSRHATIVFATMRVPPAGRARAQVLRTWLGKWIDALASPVSGAFCVDAPFDEDGVSCWHSVDDAMRSLDAGPAFGAMPARGRPSPSARRLSVGFAAAPGNESGAT